MRFARWLLPIVLLFSTPGFGQSAAPTMSWEGLQSLIRTRHITSIESLLRELPREYKDYYFLIYNTRSQQNASYELPRIVLYGRDGRFLMAVTSNPQGQGSHLVEILEYKDNTPGELPRFKPREVDFQAIEQHRNQDAFIVDPPQCASCHRETTRPNIDPYSGWSGFYGSTDNRMRVGSAEDSGYTRFLRQRPNNDRLRQLRQLSVTVDAVGDGHYRIIKNAIVDIGPLSHFQILVSAFNFRSLAARLWSNQQWRPYLSAVARLCLDSTDSNPESYLPQPLEHEGHRGEVSARITTAFADLVTSTAQAQASDFQLRRDAIQANNGPLEPYLRNIDESTVRTTALYRFASNAMGVELDNWSTSINEGSLSFATPINGILALSRYIRDLARSQDSTRYIRTSCEDLQLMSRQSLR